MKAGITGSTGVLGSRLLHVLQAKGVHCTTLVRGDSPKYAALHAKSTIIRGDITKPETLEPFVRDIDVCFHCAAQVSSSDIATYQRVNVEGTRQLCQTILRVNPKCRLVNISTISVLEIGKRPGFLVSHYARSKFAAEQLIDRLVAQGKLDAVTIYPGIIYGPHDINMLPKIIRQLRSGSLPLVSGGEHGFPFIYIDDLCDLLHLAAQSPRARGRKYLSVRSRQDEIGLHTFLFELAKRIGCPPPSKKYPRRPLFIAAALLEGAYRLMGKQNQSKLTLRIVNFSTLQVVGDYSLATSDLGWKQQTKVLDGLDIALEWLRENGELPQ